MNESLWSSLPPLIVHCTGSHRCSSTSQVSWDEGGVAPCTHISSLEQGKHTETGATLTHLQTTQTGRWTSGVPWLGTPRRWAGIQHRSHICAYCEAAASTTSPHSPRQQRKSANRFSYLGWCVCWGWGTMAAAAGRGGRPATGRCSGTGRLQTQRDVWTHEPDDNIILDAFLTQQHSCIQSFFYRHTHNNYCSTYFLSSIRAAPKEFWAALLKAKLWRFVTWRL